MGEGGPGREGGGLWVWGSVAEVGTGVRVVDDHIGDGVPGIQVVGGIGAGKPGLLPPLVLGTKKSWTDW